METIEIRIDREDVMREVDKTTDYTGSKMDESDTTRDRILMTEDDMVNLSRFWDEAAAVANGRLRNMILVAPVDKHSSEGDYHVTLEVSKGFNKALTPSVQSSLRSFFIQSIVGKWFRIANKNEAKDYFSVAEKLLDDAMRKLYSRQRPRR